MPNIAARPGGIYHDLYKVHLSISLNLSARLLQSTFNMFIPKKC